MEASSAPSVVAPSPAPAWEDLAKDKAPSLFQPIALGDMELRNRVIMAPLTRGRSGSDRIPNDLNVKYYEQRAEHTGMIIVEATTVSAQGNGWVDSPGVYSKEMSDGWKAVVDAVHAKGCKIVLQLWHIGRASHSSFHDGAQIVAPSAIKIEGDGVHAADGTKQPHEVPRALETEEIPGVVETYRQAAELGQAAGFDGIEIHSANGYLLDQFLQTCSNQRTDQYGGSVENRMRMLNEVLDAVSTVYKPSQIGVRLSPNGSFNGMGSEDNTETFTYALEQLSSRGLAYVHVMDGLGFGFHEKCPAFTVETARKIYKGNLLCNVGYTRETGNQVIADGNADAVVFGRLFIGNPDLVYRWAYDLPLAEGNPGTWFTHDSVGYADYPTYLEQQAAATTTAPPAPSEEATGSDK